MTKIKDLIATLKTRNSEAQVFLMTTRKSPFENHLAGVVGREDMFDQKFRSEPGIAADDVFLVVGRRIRPGSLSAWIVCEHHDTIVHPGVDVRPSDEQELMAATLADIVREHLDNVDSLEDPRVGGDGFHVIPVEQLRNALEAAYRAGATARDRASDADAAQPLAAIDTLQAHVE
jgi:hypothetical protein